MVQRLLETPMTTASQVTSFMYDECSFRAPDGETLYLRSFDPDAPKALVLFLHGYADHGGRYRHVHEVLAHAGYSVHALDYRGHGKAGGRRGYVWNFDDYLSDVREGVKQLRLRHPNLPLFIFAHSHGSLITAVLMANSGRPDVAGVVLSGPYFKLKLEPSLAQLVQAHVVGRLIPFLSIKNPLTSDQLSKDPEMRAASDNDPLKHDRVTPRWFSQSNAAQSVVRRLAPQFRAPVLILQGGEDPIADPAGAQSFFETVGSIDKKLVVYPEMLHEVLHEVGRDKAIAEAIAWMDAHVGSRA